MKTQSLGWLVGLGAAACSFTSCSQPATQCQVGLAGAAAYATVFTVKNGTPACAMSTPGFAVQRGDLIGMEFYNPPKADGSTYDPTKLTMAIQADTLGNALAAYAGFSCSPASCSTDPMSTNCGPVADGCGGLLDCGKCPKMGDICGGGGPSICGTKACTPQTCANLKANCGPAGDGCGGMLMCGTCSGSDTCGGNGTASVCGHVILDADTTHTAYAPGDFKDVAPDATNTCHAVNVKPAQVDLSSSPVSPGFPALSLKYEWSNLSFYTTASVQGTQFAGDLHYTQNGCAIDYHVVGMWPAVDCSETDAMGNVTGNPDETLCNPCPDPGKGRFVGSGINPDAATKCVQIFPGNAQEMHMMPPVTDPYGRHPFYCTLATSSDPPQLNPNPPTCMDTPAPM